MTTELLPIDITEFEEEFEHDEPCYARKQGVRACENAATWKSDTYCRFGHFKTTYHCDEHYHKLMNYELVCRACRPDLIPVASINSVRIK